MDLHEIGTLLREERERQGLTVDEVVERTKISRRNVEALEQGRQEDLPHLVYARGFLKNYARLLGLDADKMGNALTQAYGGEEDVFQDFESATQPVVPMAVRPSSTRKVALALTVVLILAAVAGGGYIFLSNLSLPGRDRTEDQPGLAEKKPDQPAETRPRAEAPARPAEPQAPSQSIPAEPQAPAPAAPAVPPVPAAPQEAPLAAKPAQQPAPTAPAPAPQIAPAPAQQPAPAPTSPKAVAPVAPSGPAATDKPAAAPATPERAPEAVPAQPADKGKPKDVSGKEHLVEITAKEPCWIKSLSDEDRQSREYFLKSGDSLKLPFSKVLMLKLGNAGGVSVTFDGKPYQVGGQPGQVKNLSFP